MQPQESQFGEENQRAKIKGVRSRCFPIPQGLLIQLRGIFGACTQLGLPFDLELCVFLSDRRHEAVLLDAGLEVDIGAASAFRWPQEGGWLGWLGWLGLRLGGLADRVKAN